MLCRFRRGFPPASGYRREKCLLGVPSHRFAAALDRPAHEPHRERGVTALLFGDLREYLLHDRNRRVPEARHRLDGSQGFSHAAFLRGSGCYARELRVARVTTIQSQGTRSQC